MFYNVFIEHFGDKRQYIIALNQEQMELLVGAFLKGEEKIRIKGVERNIFKPKKFVIYSITDLHLGKEQEDIEQNLKKSKLLYSRDKMSLRLFSMFGTNVTDTFLKGRDWGTESHKEQQKVDRKILSSLSGKIFISHSSKDEALVEKFIDCILILGFGLKREEIFCTSIHGTNIKSGDDFKIAIFEELRNAKVVIQIITKNYKSSEVCLNEMGAAWIIAPVIIPLVATPFNYDVGFIHASTQQLKLNDENDLVKLYDDHKERIFTNSINTANLLKQINIFIDFVGKYAAQQATKKERVFFYKEESIVQGVLRSGIFGHPPLADEEEFNKHDSFHRYFFLELNPPIDVLSNNILIEEGETDVSYFNISKVHIVPDPLDKNVKLKELEDKNVEVKGKFWGGHTAWHRAEVMMSFLDIKIID